MPDENNGGAPEAPKVDAFGEAVPAPDAAPGAKKEGEDAPAAEWKEGDPMDKHPLVLGLKAEVENVKKEYGSNLSGQREVIDRLTKQIDTLMKNGGKSPEDSIKPLHENVKHVKDLTQEEQDAMTETEKKMFDELADIKDRENAAHIEKEKAKLTGDDTKKTNVEKVAQAEALKLAGNDKTVANTILEKFNQFGGNDTLTDDEVKARVAEATKLVPDYKPPKEQTSAPRGEAPGGGQGTDPFGVDSIVKEAAAKNQPGSYGL